MAKNRTAVQRLKDRENIAQLLLQGWTQIEISRYLEIHPSTVCRDVQAIEAEWQKAAVDDIHLAKVKELERLRLLDRELWAAWHRSIGTRETTVQEIIAAAEGGEAKPSTGDRLKHTTRREVQNGDPRFLSEIIKIVGLRMEILGGFAPADNQKRVRPVITPDVAQMSDTELMETIQAGLAGF